MTCGARTGPGAASRRGRHRAVTTPPLGKQATRARFENYHHHLLLERRGKRWHKRAELKDRVNAIAWRPGKDLVYTVGDELYAVDANGKVRAVPSKGRAERDHWSACWAGGRLIAGTLAHVEEVGPRTGTTRELLPVKGRAEVGHNHALAANGEHVAFVRGGEVFVLAGERFTRIALR